MIDLKTLRTFLRKTENEFISEATIAKLLLVKNKSATEILQHLEELGYIEQLSLSGIWVHAMRGKVLAFKGQVRTYRAETLKKLLSQIIKRAEHINASIEYPYQVCCIKITSPYPASEAQTSISIAYSVERKKISDEVYEKAADKLRQKHNGSFANYIEHINYPRKALRLFLKASSPALQLTEYSKKKINLLEGKILYERESPSEG